MTLISFLVIYLSILILAIYLLYARKLEIQNSKIQFQIVNFSLYQAVFEYFMLRAYTIIYKDRILIYSLESTKLSDIEYVSATKAFVSLVLKMLGPSLVAEFTSLYGDYSTLLFVTTEYFNEKYESDEIRKASLDKLMTQQPK